MEKGPRDQCRQADSLRSNGWATEQHSFLQGLVVTAPTNGVSTDVCSFGCLNSFTHVCRVTFGKEMPSSRRSCCLYRVKGTDRVTTTFIHGHCAKECLQSSFPLSFRPILLGFVGRSGLVYSFNSY